MKLDELLKVSAGSMTLDSAGKFKISEVLHGTCPTVLRVNGEGEAKAEVVIPDEQFALEAVLIKCIRPDVVLAFLSGGPIIEGQKLPVGFRVYEPGDDVAQADMTFPIVFNKGQKVNIGVTSGIEQEIMVMLSGTAVRATG